MTSKKDKERIEELWKEYMFNQISKLLERYSWKGN